MNLTWILFGSHALHGRAEILIAPDDQREEDEQCGRAEIGQAIHRVVGETDVQRALQQVRDQRDFQHSR